MAVVLSINRERGTRQAGLQSPVAKLDRQIRNLLELIKDGHGGVAMAAELRDIERRREALQAEITAAATPEPVPDLHPNLPALYRRRVEALEEALTDPATVAPAAEALRLLIDAILVFPGERRGAVSLTRRGDLAALLNEDIAGAGPVIARRRNGGTPVRAGANRGPGEVLGTLDAGTRIGLCRTVLGGLSACRSPYRG